MDSILKTGVMLKKRFFPFVAVTLFVLFETVAYAAPRQPSAEQVLFEPKTAKQIITVGGPGTDVPGYTDAAVQIAVDALKTRGGGEVRLGPGTFQIAGPVRLASGISLIGSGESTILRKVDGCSSRLVIDGDYGMLKLTVADPTGFRPGMGVMVYDDKYYGGWHATTAKITAVEDNVLYIDASLARDYRCDRKAMISNICSLAEAVEAEDVHIADFVIDGNKAANKTQRINGCRGAGIYLHKVQRCVVQGVTVKNFNGDGISWQRTEDVTVRNCQAHNCANFGLHPGGASAGTTIEGCSSHHNRTDGIFLCWRVQNGTFKNNKIYNNGQYGISIGHKDTDNIFENNHIYENAEHGVYFRDENEQNGGHRNRFYNNIVQDNGAKHRSFGFYIDGVTHDIIIENNTIGDTGKGFQKAGVYIGQNASNIKARNNRFSGHKDGDIIDKSGKSK